MRIRQVRPEFFADGRVSRLPVGTRLTYIGLWCVADDAGWLAWDVGDLAAQLYPYESIRVRETRIEQAGAQLVESGRLIMYECGCVQIPTVPVHQRIGGTKTYTARERHERHAKPTKSIHSRTRPPVGSEVGSEVGSARERANGEDDRAALIDSFRRQGLPVDG